MDNWQHLRIKLAMEALITERVMMQAANDYRSMRGFAQAYGDESFAKLIDQFNMLNDELRNIGA